MELRAARETSGKTQAQVAKESNISETHYQNIEYGKNEPTAGISISIALSVGATTWDDYVALFGAQQSEVK